METQPSVTGGTKVKFDFGAPAVECGDLTFTYPDAGGPALKNISFSLKKGETLGIIGGTGSGKSTLASLIPHFYNVTGGKLKIFGSDIYDYNLEFLRKSIGIVPQKAALFSGTIAENMRWSNPDATEDEIIKALKIAQAWEFVRKLPEGLKTHISQGGKNFSGGQRQRLTIARALVGSPPIVILDDSMSALDYATDLKLRKALSEHLSDTAVIMISQRATTLKNADSILVLDDGAQIGLGTNEQLLESCEEYKEIYNSQMS